MTKSGLRGVLATLVVGVLLCTPFTSVRAETSTASLRAQIDSLLKVIAQLQSQLTAVQGGSSASCAALTRTLYVGLSDAETGGEVTKLQRFLGMSPTGFFGPMTEAKVKAWQAQKGIVSSGDADTTGYGLVGARTRALMNVCAGSGSQDPVSIKTPSCTIKTSNPNPRVGEEFTISWTTRGIESPVLVEHGMQGGSNVSVESNGSETYTLYETSSPIFGIGKISNTEVALCKVSVNVQSIVEKPKIVSFSPNGLSVVPSQSVSLSWKATNATSCGILYDGNKWIVMNLGTQGSYTVAPKTTTTYTLSCMGTDMGDGKDAPGVQKNLTVTVVPASASMNMNHLNTSQMVGTDAPFVLSGNTSAVGPLTVALVSTSYTGATDWNHVGVLLKDGSGYTAVSNTAPVSDSKNWSASFGGLGEGYYNVFIYDPSFNLIGTGMVWATQKG